MSVYRTFRPPHLLSQSLEEFLRTEAGCDFKTLNRLLPSEWKAVVMGGLLRDLLMKRIPTGVKPADIDLVIFGARSVDEIRSKLDKTSHSANAFGGVKCKIRPNGAVFDIWRVEDHANMAMATKPHTIEQLLRHNLLDVDAILWDPATGCLHDCGCLSAIATERVDLMGTEGISPEFLTFQVAHVLVVAFKTNFTISERLRSFVVSASAKCRPRDIEKTLERKLPNDVVQIELFWNDLLSGGASRCPAPTRASL